jgi:hypothetical protein
LLSYCQQYKEGSEQEDIFFDATEPPETPTRRLVMDEELLNSPRAKNLARTFQDRMKMFEDGYDSDGYAGPEPIDVEDEIVFENQLPDAPPAVPNLEPVMTDIENPVMVEEPPNIHVPISEAEIQKMTVAQLKDELKKRCVQYSNQSKKEKLRERLRFALTAELPVVACISNKKKDKSKKKQTKDKADDLLEFAPGSYWMSLAAEPMVVQEPENTIRLARAPTIPEEHAAQVPKKYNFGEKFDRHVFLGTSKVEKRHSNGRIVRDSNGKIIYENKSRLKGHPKAKFLVDHGLSANSLPIDFFEAFFPLFPNQYGAKTHPSVSLFTTWSNRKAILTNAGPGGEWYREWRPFTMKDVRQFLGLKIFHGLSPSPRIEWKFKSQRDDPVNGNDFVCNAFGPGAERRLKQFKAFFACQDPALPVPDRKKDPLHKVRPMVNWINFCGQRARALGRDFAIDEQSIGFQGKHIDKLRVTYKAEGDGFQADALCQDAFTYALYYRNDPAPKKYLDTGLSPLHSRVMWLFDRVEDRYHRCMMDNLYMSAKLCRVSFNHPNKVLIAGVTRKGGRGLPASVLQEEEKNKERQLGVRGTVKAAVLKGDENCPGLVANSVYDTKPVHFLSMICEEIKWIKKQRLVYNCDTGKVESMYFLRLNTNDAYNIDMGHTDISDQYRGVYRFDAGWLRNTKWWVACFEHAFGVLLVNSYITYCHVLKAAGKTRLSHYDYRKACAVAWIDKDEIKTQERQKRQRANQREQAATRAEEGKEQGETTPESTTTTSPATPASSRIMHGRRSLSSSVRQNTRANTSEQPVVEVSKKKAPSITDKTLHPISGSICKRLDRSLEHFPESPNKTSARCAVHRWAMGDNRLEYCNSIMKCSECKVSLCFGCFRLFHTQPNLVNRKAELKQQFFKQFKEEKRCLNVVKDIESKEATGEYAEEESM